MRPNPAHCANRNEDGDEYCARIKDAGEFCSQCTAEVFGCVESIDAIPDGCRPSNVTTVADDGSTTPTDASASTSITESATSDDATASSVTADDDGSSGSGETGISEPECGNGIVEPDNGENCDGAELQHTMCSEINLGDGRLSCNETGSEEECKYNFSGCTAMTFECHDGEIEGTEQCEDNDLAGQTCETLSPNYIGGTLMCTECEFNTTGCQLCAMAGDSCLVNEDCCANVCVGLTEESKTCTL